MVTNQIKKEKPKILFLCTGNSCRSQMAEGFANHFGRFVAYSAGVKIHELNPYAIEVMRELEIDISHHQSKHVDSLKNLTFDYVITVCNHAYETCPLYLKKSKILHVRFDDPPQITKGLKSKKEILFHYRRVRDEIKNFVEKLPKQIIKN